MSYPSFDSPVCLGCRETELALFNSCYLDVLKNPKTEIPEIFAVLRQWVPHIQKNIETIVAEILKRGAHVDERDRLTDMTLLQYASKAGAPAIGNSNSALQVVKGLMKKGANVHLKCRWTDMNVLHYAAHFDVAPILRFILEERRDMNVNIQCSKYNGRTALHIAANNLCLEAAQVLLEFNADITSRDYSSRTPYECVPDLSSFYNIPDIKDKIGRMKKLLSHNSPLYTNIILGENAQSGNILLQALNREKDDKIIINEHEIGISRYCGNAESAHALWAGSEDNQGKSHDSVHGVKYCKCPAKKGVYVSVSKVCRVGEFNNLKNSSSFKYSKVQMNHRKVDFSQIAAKVCCGISEGYEYRGLKIGDTVFFNRNDEIQSGIVRFIGKTKFASGYWVGIELKNNANDRHDGMIEGIRYFECPPGRGLFILASKLIRNLTVYKQSRYGEENHTSYKWLRGYPSSRYQSLYAPKEGKSSPLSCIPSIKYSSSRKNNHSDGRNDFSSFLGINILYNHKLGTIRYIGKVEFAEGYWFGLEMKEKRGKHDGTVNGKRYFKCRPGHGIMVPPKNVILLDAKGKALSANLNLTSL